MKHTFYFTEINHGAVEIESDSVPDRNTVIQAVVDGNAMWGDSEYKDIRRLDEKGLEIIYYSDADDSKEIVQGYEVKRSVVFENNQGIAFAENPDAPSPFVNWQFTDNGNGERDYYWGRYTSFFETATRDYEFRISSYHEDNKVAEVGAYKYYSTQRPVDIATYPKTESGHVRFENFDNRNEIEHGYKAWGYLVYDAPLTEKQIDDYELRPSSTNADVISTMKEQAQVVGYWEDLKAIPDEQRFTWHRPSISGFDLREPVVSPEQIAERYHHAKHELTRTDRQTSPKPIMEQLADAEKMVERNTEPTKSKKQNRDER